MSPAPVAQRPVTLRPNVRRKWDLCEEVVRLTKEYLGRPCLLRMRGRPLRMNDPEGKARDEQFAAKLRNLLDLRLAKQRGCLEAQYANSSLPVTFEAAWTHWQDCRAVFQDLYDKNDLMYLLCAPRISSRPQVASPAQEQ